MYMKLIEHYVLLINKYLEEPRNNLIKKEKKFILKKHQSLIKKYDQALLEKYCYLEKLIDIQLEEEEE